MTSDSPSPAEDAVEKPKLRVVFGGMDGRFSTVALQALASRHHLVGVIHSEPRTSNPGLLLRYARAGKNAGNLKRFADYYGCPFFSAGLQCTPELVSFLKYLRADVLCLSNFSIILPPDIFELPKLGTINLHLSALPEHRGPNPWLWMFYDGDTTGKVSVLQVDAGEDTGDILASESFPIAPNITSGELADQVLPTGARLLADVVDKLAQGELKGLPQPSAQGYRRARYVPPGEALIDWQKSGCEPLGSFLRGASLWYDPLPAIPGFYREYHPGLKGDPGGSPGSNHWRGKSGWISCVDGRVPYSLHIDAYEFPRLLWPPLLACTVLLML